MGTLLPHQRPDPIVPATHTPLPIGAVEPAESWSLPGRGRHAQGDGGVPSARQCGGHDRQLAGQRRLRPPAPASAERPSSSDPFTARVMFAR